MIEGVADKVEVQTGDARKLPFDDASFDVVLSSMALHNIYNAGERQTAVREIARVLKVGGRVLIVDVRHTQPIRRHAARRWFRRRQGCGALRAEASCPTC